MQDDQLRGCCHPLDRASYSGSLFHLHSLLDLFFLLVLRLDLGFRFGGRLASGFGLRLWLSLSFDLFPCLLVSLLTIDPIFAVLLLCLFDLALLRRSFLLGGGLLLSGGFLVLLRR